MQPDEPRRILHRGCDVLERNRRGVGGQDGVRLGFRFERREQTAFRLNVFEDRLDDHVRARDSVAGNVRKKAVARIANAARVAQAIREQFGRATHCGREPLGILILQGDGQPAQRAPCRDIAAHRARADHMDVRGFEIAFLAECLEPLLQPEEADEIGRRRCFKERRNRRRIGGRNRQRVAIVVDENIEDGVGRRIVLAPGALRHLFSRLRCDQPTHQRV